MFEELKNLKAKRIFIQYPEGLKTKIQKIDEEMQNNGFETVLCCEPTFGACDVRDVEAKRLGCDAILHIGHSDFGVSSEIPVVYVDYFLKVDPIPIIEKEFQKIKDYESVGLFTTLQYVPVMKEVEKWLKSRGKKVEVAKTEKHDGQVLGCRVDAALKLETSCLLYVGTGKFHPLGVALLSNKPVFSLDLERGEIIDFEKEKMKYIKKKLWKNEEIKNAKVIGILVSWKKGQNRINEAFALKHQLEKMGKKVHILAFDAISKEKIIGMKFDLTINMACPRMDDEDL
ncbi:MAG: diphthamide biosynthesis enzyme Dph2 [Candidatus Aenigmatarchaeota archaeon]